MIAAIVEREIEVAGAIETGLTAVQTTHTWFVVAVASV